MTRHVAQTWVQLGSNIVRTGNKTTVQDAEPT